MVSDLIYELSLQKKDEIKLLANEAASKRLKGQINITETLWQEKCDYFAGYYRKVLSNMEFIKGVQSNDNSIIYNIHCLNSILEVADTEALCTGIVYLALKEEGQAVHFCAPDSSGPEMSLEFIEQKLTNLDSERWTLETLKQKIPAECKSAISHEESCPEIETGYQDAIKIFEV